MLTKSMRSLDSLLATWTHTSTLARKAFVIPDGCQDIVIEQRRNGEMSYVVTDLSRSTCQVDLKANTHLTGLRLRPGTRIAEDKLARWASNNDLRDLLICDQLNEFCVLPSSIAEILECLRSDVSTVAEAARRLGVTSRTLQRTVKQGTDVTPHFWIALARVRRACRSMPKFEKIADAAMEFGYADQAHMTREVGRWLGVTPTAVKAGTELYDQLNQRGYG